jgi:hypothetical protein
VVIILYLAVCRAVKYPMIIEEGKIFRKVYPSSNQERHIFAERG